MIEFLSSLTILCLVIPSFLAMLYLGVARASTNFILKQTGVCLSFEKSASTCKLKSLKLIKRLLPLGTIRTFEVTRSKNLAVAKLRFSITDGIQLNNTYTISLPLKAQSL